MKNAIKVIAFNILLFLILCLAAELFLRLLFPNFIPYKRTINSKDAYLDSSIVPPPLSWVRFDKELGWISDKKPDLKFSNITLNKMNVVYRINSQGFRDSSDFDLKNYNANNIMLLGDSYLFGVYLNEEDTFSSQLKKEFGNKAEFFSLGIPGWGLDQMLLCYKKYNHLLNPKVVVLFYIDDDIVRVLESYRIVERIAKPSFEIINGNLSLRKKEEKNILTTIFENSFLLNKFYKRYMEYEAVEISRKIFEELMELTKKNDQKLIVVRIPWIKFVLEKVEMARFSMNDLFKEKKTPYLEIYNYWSNLDTNEVKKYYIEDDGHLTKVGSKYVANLVSDILKSFLN